MTTPERQPELIHVGRPVKRINVTFEPVVPLSGPVTDGPLILVGRPVKVITPSSEAGDHNPVGLRFTPGPGTDAAAVARVFNQFARELEELGGRVELTPASPVPG